MATTFPEALDNFTNPTSSDTLDSPSHSEQHADVNDAVEAVEAFVLGTVFDVRAYGATGDGTTDDTTAIQDAIDAAKLAGAGIYEAGATVYFPPGRYRITSPLAPEGTCVYRGAGREATVIYADGCSGFVFTTGTFNETQWLMTFEDFTLRGDYTADKIGFDLEYTHQLHFNRVYVREFDSHGIAINNCLSTNLTQCYLRDNDGSGIHIGPIGGPVTITGGRIRFNNRWGVEIAGTDANNMATGITVLGVDIERNRLGALSADYARNISVLGGHHEVNHFVNTDPPARDQTFTEPTVGTDMQFGAASTVPVTALVVVGVNFGDIQPATDEGYQLDLDHVDGALIAGNTFDWATKAIRRDDAINLEIRGNYYGSNLDEPEDNGLIQGRAKDASLTYLGVPGVNFHSVTTLALAADTTYYEPFFVERAISVDQINLGVTTAAGASETARLGIYRADENLQPTTLVVDGGNVAIDSTGQKTATVDVVLTPGRYLKAVNAGDAVTCRALLAPAHAGNNISSATPLITQWRKAETVASFAADGTNWDTTGFGNLGHHHVVHLRVSAFVDKG
jgi:hypothetical protein